MTNVVLTIAFLREKKQEHAKALRESITYYLCTHEENELIMPEIKDIARQHVRPLFITQKFCGDHLFLK